MKSYNRILNLGLACGCLFAITRSANAYVDPGSGSYLLQVLFAGLLGGLYFAKSAILNFKSMIVRKVRARKPDDSAKNVG